MADSSVQASVFSAVSGNIRKIGIKQLANVLRNSKIPGFIQTSEALEMLGDGLNSAIAELNALAGLSQGSGGTNPPGITEFAIIDEQYGGIAIDQVTVENPGSIEQISFFAPSVDETDIGWNGTGTIDATTDPVTFTPTITGNSRYGVFCLAVNVTAGGSGYTTAAVQLKNGTANVGTLSGTVALNAGAVAAVLVTAHGTRVPAGTTAVIVGDGTGAIITPVLSNFLPGDYILWNDPANGYEIDFVQDIDSSSGTPGDITLLRAADPTAPTVAQFQSLLATHTAQPFYRLVPQMLSAPVQVNVAGTVGPTTDSGVQARYLFPLPNRCVAALYGQAVSTVGDSASTGLNLNNSALTPPSPGYRTVAGNAYFLSRSGDPIAVGFNADFPITVVAPETVRCVYAFMAVAPDADCKIAVFWNSNDLSTFGLIDVVTIPSGQFVSWPAMNPPVDLRMPYHTGGWAPTTQGQHDWPPGLLPKMSDKTSSYTLDTSTSVVFAEGGFLDFVVVTAGATTGRGLVVVVET